MHQQVRTSTKKSGSASSGPGAMADEGSLVDVLRLLHKENINLRAAGGRDLDDGGPFVFAVGHGQDEDQERPSRAVKVLRGADYAADDYDVEHYLVDDRPGALLECIEEVERRARVYEIFVGTPDEPGAQIPVQITTRDQVGGDYER